MEKNLLTGKIYKKLLLFTFPILLALFLQAAYGAVDLLVVGKFGTRSDISGVSTGSQLMHSLTMIISCFATGATVYIGNNIGNKNEEEANKAIGNSIILFLFLGIILTLLFELIAVPFCKLMNAPEEAFDETVNYVRICSSGFIFIAYYNLLGSICRGLGDSKTPLITVLISAILNVGLDLLFCASFKMGSSGAALATIISQAVSVIVTLIILKNSHSLSFNFHLTKKEFKLEKRCSLAIMRLGLPLAIQELLVGISFLVIVAIVNKIGLVESAGIGIAEKLCGFIMLVPSAFSQSISAFVAQNVGAKQYKRANKSLVYGIITSLACACVLFYFGFFKGEDLAYIFSSDLEANAKAAEYLKAYAIDVFLTSFLFCLTGYLNGQGKTTLVMVEGVVGAFLVRIPVCFLMSKIENTSLFYIGLSTPCSTIVQIIICLTYIAIIRKSLNRGE